MKMRIHFWVRFETFTGSNKFREGAACGHPQASYFAKKSVREVNCQNCWKYVRDFRIARVNPDTPQEP